MKLGIRSKLFLVALGLIILSVLVVYFSARGEMERDVVSRIREDLAVRVQLVASSAADRNFPIADGEAWDALADRLGELAAARVTFVANDGRVLGDSMVAATKIADLDNHSMRPEIQSALLEGKGQSRRYSLTKKREMIYVAVPIRHEKDILGVARVALPVTNLESALRALREALIIAAGLALGMAVLVASFGVQLAARTVRTLTDSARRMAGGDLEVRVRAQGSDEFAELGRALDRMAKSLSGTLGELREERDRLSGILQSMEEGVLFLDEEGKVVLINPTLREMLLLSSDEDEFPAFQVVEHAELRELLDFTKLARPAQREIEIGGLKPRKLFVRAMRLEGEQRGMLAVFVDVTETRRLENMRREFVANVSHELRTPVTSIRSAGESLRTALTSQPQMVERFVGIVERNAERLQTLVEDLLDLSRIESREYSIDFEAVDPRRAIEDTLALFSDKAARFEVELIADVGTSELAHADSRALGHVLSNLVDNAVKYGGRGKSVRVRAGDEGGKIVIAVMDDGPGIPERHWARLFERFYRIDAGRSRDVGGTGLGLSIVKHLVDSMGGSVRVESAEGAGTSFIVTLNRFIPRE